MGNMRFCFIDLLLENVCLLLGEEGSLLSDGLANLEQGYPGGIMRASGKLYAEFEPKISLFRWWSRF
jgi:hypothetical protein